MNGTDIHVREATEADIPRVLEIYRSSGIDDTEYAADDRILAVWKRMKSYPDYRVYVAETEGTVCGTFALLVMDNLAHGGLPSAVAEDVAVAAEYQGRGIGGAMMRYALERCRAAGCYKLSLSSNKKRKEAHRFYERLGFTRHGFSFSIRP